MKLGAITTLLALVLLCSQASANLLCKSLLFNPNHLTLSSLKRAPHEIGNSGHAKEAIKVLSPHINETAFPPHTRGQCYGTCYAYSNTVLVENALKLQGVLPPDSLLLISPILAQTALRRRKNNLDLSIDESITGGSSDVFFDINNSSLFYVPNESIRLIGSSKKLLKLETEFFHAFSEGLFLYRGLGLKETLQQGSIFSPQRNIAFAFQEYIRQKTGVSLRLNRTEIGTVKFFNISSYKLGVDQRLVSAHVSTAQHSSPQSLAHEVGHLFRLRQPLPNSPFSFASENFMEKLFPSLVRNLRNNHFARISFKSEVFGGPHTVILTNLVINHDNNTLLGFLFLNSYSPQWGYEGYGFVSVQELLSYADGYEILTHLETKN